MGKSVKMQQKTELTVITKANDLCAYVLTVTEKSPKRFRFTVVSNMQNLTLDVIENLYRANEVFVGTDGDVKAKIEKRLDFQHSALTSLKVLGIIAQIAREQGCILPKQYEQITKNIYDCQNLLGAWINSEKQRY